MMGPGSLRKKLSFRKKKSKRNDQLAVASSSSSSTTVPCSPPLGSFPVPTSPSRLAKEPSRGREEDNGSFPSDKLPPQRVRTPHVKQQQQYRRDTREQNSASSARQKHHHSIKTTKDTVAAAAALDNEGNSLLEKGEYTRAMESYERALKLKRLSLQTCRTSASEDLLASVATSINNIGFLRQRSGASPTESMAAYQDSLRIKREILGDKSLSVGKTLNNIGSVHYSSKQFTQALRSYVQAKSIMEHNLGKHHLDVATVYSNIGDVYMAQGKRREAHQQYKQALEIRWIHLDEHNPKIRRLLEKIAVIEMNQEALTEYKDEDEHEDDRIFEEEIPVLRELHKLHTEVEADIKEITDLRRKMALDMVKDKLRILKGMRSIEQGGFLDEESTSTPEEETAKTPPPLSPMEREDALLSVKERLSKLREQRAQGGSMPCMSHEEEDAEIERQLGLVNMELPKLNLESVFGW